jgi:hypothetical protein
MIHDRDSRTTASLNSFSGILRSVPVEIIKPTTARPRRRNGAAAGPSFVLSLCMALYSVLSLTGCSSQSPQPAIQVPLSDIHAVTGEWEGSVRTIPQMKFRASIFLIINEEGVYNFVAEDSAAIGLGMGMLSIEDGMLVSSSEGREVRMRLYDRNGQQILVGPVRNAKGKNFHLQVTRRNQSSP